MNSLLLLLLIIFYCVIGEAQAIKPATPEPAQPPVTQLRFPYEDKCGSPLYESMAWESVEGRVMDVIDGNTITIVLKDKSRRRITLVAVDAARPGRPFGDMARKKLADLVLNEAIEIWVLPSWGKSKRLTGVVHANGKDINQALIESGIVRYKRPESYSVSDYTACVYRILEGEAREAKRGLWGHATP